MLQVPILLSDIIQWGLGDAYESYSSNDYREDELQLSQFLVFFLSVVVVGRMTIAFF